MFTTSVVNEPDKSTLKKEDPKKRIRVYEENGKSNSFDLESINQINGDSHTYLSYAVAHHYGLFAEALLKYKADPNQINEFGKFPLTYAVQGEDEQLVKLLLEHKADANKKNSLGKNTFFGANDRIRSILTGNPSELSIIKENKIADQDKLKQQDLVSKKT